MLRRTFWLAVGLGAGVTATVLVARWTRRQRERLAPANVARRAGASLTDLGATITGAVREFRAASAEREREIRANLAE